MDKTSLGDRMKEYEKVAKSFLMRRTPVIIRIDGKCFSNYTKGCDKPFDQELHEIRSNVAKYLCDNIQGCILSYSQSDEITLVLKDWQTLQTCAWFDNNLQKLVSVSASMCTAKWNELAREYGQFDGKLAVFDSRVFNVPKEEVLDVLRWRQQDWERNSVQMLARSLYSHKECHKLNCKQLITKIEEERGILWSNFESWMKRGEVYITEDKEFCDKSFMDGGMVEFINNQMYNVEEK